MDALLSRTSDRLHEPAARRLPAVRASHTHQVRQRLHADYASHRGPRCLVRHPAGPPALLHRSPDPAGLAALHRLLSYAAGRTAEAERNRESGAHALFHQYLTRTPHAADTYHRTARTLLPQSRKLRQRNREHRKYLPECPKHATDCL